MMTDGISLKKIWWLWVPCVFMAIQAVCEATLPGQVMSRMLSENGPHELLQFAVMASACILGLRMLLMPQLRSNPWLMAWIGLAAAASFYVAGEEISWGQQFVHWATPDSWMAVNDQGETNLHNTSSWFDQKPRLILLIGVYIGGIIIPVLARYKKEWLPTKFDMIYPPAILTVTALFTLAIRLIDIADSHMADIVIFARSSEVEELYSFYFVLLYLVILRRRILRLVP